MLPTTSLYDLPPHPVVTKFDKKSFQPETACDYIWPNVLDDEEDDDDDEDEEPPGVKLLFNVAAPAGFQEDC